MSTRFTVWCETHEVPGPHIRRHHSSALFLQEQTARFFPVSEEDEAADEWGLFLIEHEYCQLRLEREWYPAKTSYKIEQAELVKTLDEWIAEDEK